MCDPRYLVEIFEEEHPEDYIARTDWWLNIEDAIAWAKKISLLGTRYDCRVMREEGYYEDDGYWIQTKLTEEKDVL